MQALRKVCNEDGCGRTEIVAALCPFRGRVLRARPPFDSTKPCVADEITTR